MAAVPHTCPLPDTLYPRTVYRCPNGHGEFRSYAFGGAVCWACPTCSTPGVYVGTKCCVTGCEAWVERADRARSIADVNPLVGWGL